MTDRRPAGVAHRPVVQGGDIGHTRRGKDVARRPGLTLGASLVGLLVMLPSAAAQAPPPASITLDPRWAQVGSTVTVDGVDFDPACPIDVTIDDRVATTVTPEEDGTFSVDVTVPDVPVGDHLVVADQRVHDCAPVDREVLDVFTFEVSPDTGAAGSTTTASGAGFPDSRECGLVAIGFDGDPVAAVGTEGFPGDGFAVDVVVPDRPPGTYVVEALQDGCGTRRGTDTFRVPPEPTPPPTPTETRPPDPTETPTADPTEPPTTAPTLSIDPEAGPIGTEATAEGADFDAGVLVEIRMGEAGATTVPPAQVSDGAFSVPVVVPEGIPGGVTTVTACQRCGTADERVATTTFLVTPRLFLDPAVGPPGLVTRAHGDGFPAGAEVDLAWQPGIGTVTSTTDELGLLRAFVLVVHRDRVGPRELVATVSDAAGTTLVVPYLVVPGSGQPRDFSSRR